MKNPFFMSVILLALAAYIANQVANQTTFRRIFGFYSPGNFLQMRGHFFGCLDCDSVYLRFNPSERELEHILQENKECNFEAYHYRKHGDYIGGVRIQSPGWMRSCTRGKVCPYGEGALWLNSRTNEMCYGHIIIY